MGCSTKMIRYDASIDADAQNLSLTLSENGSLSLFPGVSERKQSTLYKIRLVIQDFENGYDSWVFAEVAMGFAVSTIKDD